MSGTKFICKVLGLYTIIVVVVFVERRNERTNSWMYKRMALKLSFIR